MILDCDPACALHARFSLTGLNAQVILQIYVRRKRRTEQTMSARQSVHTPRP